MERNGVVGLFSVVLISAMAFGQAADAAKKDDAAVSSNRATPATSADAVVAGPNAAVIPAGTKIPLALKQAISTENAREGDAVYAETVFPFVLNDRMLIPAGTYIQGKIMRSEHAGRSRKR